MPKLNNTSETPSRAESAQASCSDGMFRLRNAIGLTQTEFAKAIGIKRSAVADKETGRREWDREEISRARKLADQARRSIVETLTSINRFWPPVILVVTACLLSSYQALRDGPHYMWHSYGQSPPAMNPNDKLSHEEGGKEQQ